MTDIKDYDLTRHNTFGITASCRRFMEFADMAELKALLASLTDTDKPLLVIGGGSNLLLTCNYVGTVIHSAIRGMEVSDSGEHVLLRVGSGENWDALVALCVANGWHGMENLSLIPGEVGASAVQNIGAYGVEAKDIIYCVEAMDMANGNAVTFSNEDCGYAYRKSRFKGEWKGRYIITHVTYRLSKKFRPNIDYGNIRSELQRHNISEPTAAQLRQTIIDIRNAKLPDPKTTGNAGSFFMNPIVTRDKYEKLAAIYPELPHYTLEDGREKVPAGWLIERCGWKGRAMGRAGVHPQQALVLVNLGGATGEEILQLCNAIRHDVANTFGIDLTPEVNII